MTLPYLPDDCIYDIIKHLQNYPSTLFNCLLVNRFWCKTTVLLLYANPFDNITNKNNHSIILTFISCFKKIEILQLKNQLKFININDIININDEYELLFEYPKYLENFDYDKINSTIFQWLGYPNLSHDQRSKIHDSFIPTFYQSILPQCVNIKQLNISPIVLYLYGIKTFSLKTLARLNSLTLHLNMTNNEEILNDISNNICLNLKKLEILFRYYYTYTNSMIKEKLCTIIKKQNNLKVFKILYCDSYLLGNIFLSLEFQKYSLIYIEFNNVNFCNVSFKNFVNLHNLKYLRFDDCKGISLDQCDTLNLVQFQLEYLMLRHNQWHKNITPLMIKYIGVSLKELIIIEPLKVPIIENISIYCLDLITLEIEITHGTDLSTFPYFKSLEIKALNLNIFAMSEKLTKLANNLLNNVIEVSIRFQNSHNSLYLKEFLENCHDYLETINICHFVEIEFLKIILNYTERSNNNNLKFLGMTRLEKVLNNEESKLLDQIKAKGVKIVDFYSIYKKDDRFSFII